MTDDAPTAPRALEGVRVIDLATVIAGPGAAKYLADFGAEVIKVERPGGDATRGMGWTGPQETDSYFWKLVNRGKSSLVLNLKADPDRDRFLVLIDQAQVLIENMRPGRLESLNLAPEDLLRRNPALVILRVTGFGQDGPYAQRPGFATIAEAMSGFADLTGEPGEGPLLPPIALTDEVTALVAAFATMVALRHAERTGQGQVVDVNLVESMLQIMGPLPSAYAHLGYVQPRLGSGIPYTVPRGTYRCADGIWVAISASADSVAQRLLALLGVSDDVRFETFRGRSENREVLEKILDDWVAERDSKDVLAQFAQVDAAVSPVYSMEDIFADPHFQARGSLITVDGIVMQGPVARMSKTPGKVNWAGPALGEDPRAGHAGDRTGGWSRASALDTSTPADALVREESDVTLG